MSVNEAFCVTGSDDGFLRVWPLDFKSVYLEAGERKFAPEKNASRRTVRVDKDLRKVKGKKLRQKWKL